VTGADTIIQHMTVDYDLVYDTLQNDLGDLEAFLAAISVFVQAQP
jgi:uncharacterized protein YutE (UPF0331/DUF86 family)